MYTRLWIPVDILVSSFDPENVLISMETSVVSEIRMSFLQQGKYPTGPIIDFSFHLLHSVLDMNGGYERKSSHQSVL